MIKSIVYSFLVLLGASCSRDNNQERSSQTLWVYTSMYKDTINDLKPLLKKDFPGVEIKWYQAGSEDIATKVNGELLAANLQADVLISSDRFWYEEMANNEKLLSYTPKGTEKISPTLKHPEAFYTAVSIPVMVIIYNSSHIKEKDAPKSFQEMSDPKWKGKFTTGSPLSSGTNFTTMAMMQKLYGWSYFKSLRENETIAEGGNSSTLRRIQSGERPVGWVLLENILRFQGKDDRLKIVYPSDGVVTHANVLAITKKEGKRELAQKFADWMFSKQGQMAMTRSYMYSPIPSFDPPRGAPGFEKILNNSFPWTKEFINTVTKQRSQLKEKYTEIMFN